MTSEQCEIEGISPRCANSPFVGSLFGKILAFAAILGIVATLVNN